LPGLTVNVNISAGQLRDEELARFVGDTLTEFGVPAGALTLEITESALPPGDEHLVRRLAALKGAGVRLAVDDFGTGYSSMSHLGRLPIDQLKIDKSLIDGIGTDPRSFAVARSVIELGRVLELETVAEGIERPDQLAALDELSCALARASSSPIRSIPMSCAHSPGATCRRIRRPDLSGGSGPARMLHPVRGH
jgi:EAL domain-containing protein (putative c-di-GMP-specific phosphodiesterase class I)